MLIPSSLYQSRSKAIGRVVFPGQVSVKVIGPLILHNQARVEKSAPSPSATKPAVKPSGPLLLYRSSLECRSPNIPESLPRRTIRIPKRLLPGRRAVADAREDANNLRAEL